MNEREKGFCELPISAKCDALVDPNCEEGGDAKLQEAVGANAGLATICESEPVEFCITEKNERPIARSFSRLSR